jgi:hypothetical protein
MHKVLALGAGIIVMLALSSVAAARGPANEFAVGSAKSETVVILGAEHASFSAHNTTGPRCEATGQIVYKSEFGDFTAKIVELTIVENRAFFGGPITKVESGVWHTGQSAYFDVTDSGMPGGMGDTFQLSHVIDTPAPGFVLCFTPLLPGYPIAQGNIVIKTTGMLP